MKVLIPLFAAFFLSLTAILRTDGFSVQKIYGELVDGNALEPSGEIVAKLRERYYYLAKGRQCFVFASEDGKEVIKFLNYNRFYFPRCLSFFKDYALKRSSRYQKTTESFTLAASLLPQETGIQYLHLQKGEGLPTIELLGPGGSRKKIDLNKVAFVLQKKIDAPIFEKLDSIAKEKGEEGLQKALVSVISLLQKRCDLGIGDDDRDIEINFGFSGDEPLLIDPGRLFFSVDLNKEVEMRAATKKLHKWLSRHYPSSAKWLSMAITSESSVCKKEL